MKHCLSQRKQVNGLHSITGKFCKNLRIKVDMGNITQHPVLVTLYQSCVVQILFNRKAPITLSRPTHTDDHTYATALTKYLITSTDYVIKAVARALIGGGGGVYSYIRVMID